VAIGLLAAAVVSGPGVASASPAADGAVTLRAGAATSQYLAGWVFGRQTSAVSKVTFKAPTLTCTTALQGVAPTDWVFSGSTTTPKEQAAGLLSVCSGGKKAYIPYLVINGNETNLTKAVAAGDLVQVTVSASPAKVWATVADLTSPRRFSKTLSGVGSGALQEQLGDGRVFHGGTLMPVVKFAAASWTNGSINKTALGSVTPKISVNMQTGATLQIATTALSPTGPTANTFKTIWRHS
jgi:hypothetical protein